MAKKQKPLSPAMQDCLRRFSTAEFVLPFGKDVRTCEALLLRGLLESEHRCVRQIVTSQGVISDFRNAYRGKPTSVNTTDVTNEKGGA